MNNEMFKFQCPKCGLEVTKNDLLGINNKVITYFDKLLNERKEIYLSNLELSLKKQIKSELIIKQYEIINSLNEKHRNEIDSAIKKYKEEINDLNAEKRSLKDNEKLTLEKKILEGITKSKEEINADWEKKFKSLSEKIDSLNSENKKLFLENSKLRE